MAGRMRKTVFALLMSTLAVSACGTKANPFNWFGGSRSAAAPVSVESGDVNPLIPTRTGVFNSDEEEITYYGQLLDTVSTLVVERVPGGAIIRVTGVPARQGVYAVNLTPVNSDNTPVEGVLTFRLEGLQGPSAGAGSPASREVAVALKLSNQALEGTRTIRVEAAQNALQARR